ncbi:NADPH-dependent oxidoreductase [Chitinibacter fontanus]|uniref:NADPH-dependent oxidoreductase n=1 Tax=Chitinibacter fontanus TaxID=1737446 RepID=A0A7D5VBM1_9NEIS|nr:NADPH-dependent oxidoreductase [Chitinibacter fontanus]QLI83011.1 NADPH-dependent oxidoreductase [Chitinibacter fontanus]
MGKVNEIKPDALIGQRYGQASFATLPAISPAIETLLSHRTVRAFTSAPLAEGTLELLVSAAQSAPSSSNLQVWSVVAIEDHERKARLAQLAGNQAHIHEAPLLLLFTVDLSRLKRIAENKQTPLAGIDYLDTLIMGFIDAALAAQNALVAAESLGLGTVYIGALRNKPEAVADELGLPAHVFPAFGLVVGHPDTQRPAAIKPRLPQRTVLHREQYSTGGEAEAIAKYDEILREFQRSQGLPAQDWSEQASNRLRGPESLNGRDQLSAALRRQGFVFQ